MLLLVTANISGQMPLTYRSAYLKTARNTPLKQLPISNLKVSGSTKKGPVLSSSVPTLSQPHASQADSRDPQKTSW